MLCAAFVRNSKTGAGTWIDYFTTSLTISPLKNATLLNEVGEAVAAEYCHGATAFLNSDFKKKNGYKRSVELSELYGLYRQDYCGCVYSSCSGNRKKEQKRRKNLDRDKMCADKGIEGGTTRWHNYGEVFHKGNGQTGL